MATALLETMEIKQAIAKEQGLPSGAYEIRFYIASPITKEDLNRLHAYLLEQGVDVMGVLEQRAQGLWQVRVKYRRHREEVGIGVFPLAVIPLVVPLGIMVLIAIGIFKVETLTRSLTPLILGLGVLSVAAVYAYSRAERTRS